MSSDMDDSKCAVWYWRYGTPGYNLCESWQEAAEYAVSLADWEEGSPEAVQFPDGAVIPLDGWPPYEEAQQRAAQRAREYANRARSEPPRPTRRISAPIGTNQTLIVDADEPQWLGRT